MAGKVGMTPRHCALVLHATRLCALQPTLLYPLLVLLSLYSPPFALVPLSLPLPLSLSLSHTHTYSHTFGAPLLGSPSSQVELGGVNAPPSPTRWAQIERETKAMVQGLGPRTSASDWMGFRPTVQSTPFLFPNHPTSIAHSPSLAASSLLLLPHCPLPRPPRRCRTPFPSLAAPEPSPASTLPSATITSAGRSVASPGK